MKVAEARARFGEVLDEAEKGSEVVIERRGVRFRVVAEQPPAARPSGPPLFEQLDSHVLRGQWTWTPDATGFAFTARRKRR